MSFSNENTDPAPCDHDYRYLDGAIIRQGDRCVKCGEYRADEYDGRPRPGDISPLGGLL